MKSDTRLVKYIQRPDKTAAKLRGQIDALALAARQGRRQTVECEISQTDVRQKPQSDSDLRQQPAGYLTVSRRQIYILEKGVKRIDLSIFTISVIVLLKRH